MRPNYVNGRDMDAVPEGMKSILLGMGCFWGAEKKLASLKGVWVTSVGYAGGTTKNPTYKDVCAGNTGHIEVVKVTYNPKELPTSKLLDAFWDLHDPTQGDRQGPDVGYQYRSAILTSDKEDFETATKALDTLRQKRPAITTHLQFGAIFYPAEDYHQQYLAKKK